MFTCVRLNIIGDCFYIPEWLTALDLKSIWPTDQLTTPWFYPHGWAAQRSKKTNFKFSESEHTRKISVVFLNLHVKAKATKMADVVSSTKAPHKITKIGAYHVGKTIGKGNFAVVKLAEHSSANEKVRLSLVNSKNSRLK